METRNRILSRVSRNKPEAVPCPAIPDFAKQESDLLHRFSENLEMAGGSSFLVDENSLEEKINEVFASPESALWAFGPNDRELSVEELQSPSLLDGIDLVILNGKFMVAENGAVWLDETVLPARALMCLAERVAIVVSDDEIVADMHEAYSKLSGMDGGGFGLFLSGPSKTADIEQSLVLGAHGAKTLSIFVIKTKSK
ncbi:hypothetical protein FUAX_14950 [Fulvitalea axinellae]|uniref:LUD domain-containing protein n=1 Tax=Fulvitalea axinellae TaxID=1182444 RepID=A0AAU9CM03_9BACT|nr:hypothetical protein FUAX_14950 [Fulvitalea axinellae]